MIILISDHHTLPQKLEIALPTHIQVAHFNTLDQAKALIGERVECAVQGDLILVDATATPTNVTACYSLCQEMSAQHISLIAIIAQSTDREAVLQAGADDYLLTPLVPREIQNRLTYYLNNALHGFEELLKTIHHIHSGASPYALNRGVRSLAVTFNAEAAWLLLSKTTDTTELQLAGQFNLPARFKHNPNRLIKETEKYLAIPNDQNSTPRVVNISTSKTKKNQQKEASYYLIIPLKTAHQLMGVLILTYPNSLTISKIEQKNLTALGQNIGMLLDMFHRQEESQVHAMQNALLILITRVADKQSDLDATLSLMLELTTPLFNASGSNIWLFSSDQQRLELISSLSNRFSNRQTKQREIDQGLIGWVAKHQQSLSTLIASEDSRFDPNVDKIDDIDHYSLLAIPLRDRSQPIGVLAIHNENQTSFNEQDRILLEGVAALTASVVVNRQMWQELRDYADQQKVLYEMSQQIAVGLDLDGTLSRALYWVGRLVETEISLLWMIEPAKNNNVHTSTLRLVTTSGFESRDIDEVYANLEAGWVAQVMQHGRSVIVNNSADLDNFSDEFYRNFHIMPRNVISLPINYHGRIIGVISLLNKVDGGFSEADLTLLNTAVEIIAVAVGNAQLHKQTIDLIEERERLYNQMTQTERLVTVGRLTASLSHEINNPMQTIQGSLVLAMEELDDPVELKNYIQMSLNETKRVVQLVSRMRQLYQPRTDKPRPLDINSLLQEATAIGQRELKRKKVILELDLAEGMPRTIAIGHQLHLVFVNLILNLSDVISLSGRGILRLRTLALPEQIRIEFCTDANSIELEKWIAALQLESKPKMAEVSFGTSMSYDIIAAHHGSIYFKQHNQEAIWAIEIPISSLEV